MMRPPSARLVSKPVSNLVKHKASQPKTTGKWIPILCKQGIEL